MSKKRDDFGTIRLTQEELMAKMPPKRTPPPPRPPEPTPPKPLTAQKPETPAAAKPAAVPVPKPTAKPGRTILESPLSELSKTAPLGEEAKPLATSSPSLQAALQALQEKQLFLDAVNLLAFALPKREAIGWCLHCVKPVYGSEPPKPAGGVFHATQLWLADPNDNHRRLAQTAAENAEVGTPAGCLGMAVFFSGGSLAPPTAPAVPPKPQLTHQMVAGGLQMAAVLSEPEKAPEKLATFLADGLKLAALVTEASVKAGTA